MPIRSVIAVFLLLNYLLVVGAGCVNRPEDQRERVLVQTFSDDWRYQECRYLRMDGLESFLADALANRYTDSSNKAPQHLFFVINGVDAHSLPAFVWPCFLPAYRIDNPIMGHEWPISIGQCRNLYTPPWLG